MALIKDSQDVWGYFLQRRCMEGRHSGGSRGVIGHSGHANLMEVALQPIKIMLHCRVALEG